MSFNIVTFLLRPYYKECAWDDMSHGDLKLMTSTRILIIIVIAIYSYCLVSYCQCLLFIYTATLQYSNCVA